MLARDRDAGRKSIDSTNASQRRFFAIPRRATNAVLDILLGGPKWRRTSKAPLPKTPRHVNVNDELRKSWTEITTQYDGLPFHCGLKVEANSTNNSARSKFDMLKPPSQPGTINVNAQLRGKTTTSGSFSSSVGSSRASSARTISRDAIQHDVGSLGRLK